MCLHNHLNMCIYVYIIDRLLRVLGIFILKLNYVYALKKLDNIIFEFFQVWIKFYEPKNI